MTVDPVVNLGYGTENKNQEVYPNCLSDQNVQLCHGMFIYVVALQASR